jgi:hypothetical protein
MNFDHAFDIIRKLGMTKDGAPIPFEALTAIHFTHRVFAIAVALVVITFALRLYQTPGLETLGLLLAILLALQIALGISNVVFGLPLACNAAPEVADQSRHNVTMSAPSAPSSPTTLVPMPKWRQYWLLTKPRVTQLAVFCAVIGMFLATEGGLPDWQVVLPATAGIWLLAGAAFAVNCLIESEIDARMRRTQGRATARGCRRHGYALFLGQPADHVADFRHIYWLCPDLHRPAQTQYTTKHRDWRTIRCHAAGTGLGCGSQCRSGASLGSGTHHLHVDTATFLGTGLI